MGGGIAQGQNDIEDDAGDDRGDAVEQRQAIAERETDQE